MIYIAYVCPKISTWLIEVINIKNTKPVIPTKKKIYISDKFIKE
jgi:hypothetical protein